MTISLVSKELRESAGLILLGSAALLIVTAGNMGLSPIPGLIGPSRYGQIPFLDDSFLYQFGFAAFGLAVALGFKQSVGDFFGEAQLFLLHRPIPRSRIYLTKLVVGMAAYFVLAGAAVFAYALWAASPGTHASPFDWQMTLQAWTVWLSFSGMYLGAFLSGIRPAAWFGSRLSPLAASVLAAFSCLVILPTWLAWPGVIAWDALLVTLILYVVGTRDFA